MEEFKYLGKVICKHEKIEEIKESCKRQACHRITCKDHERKICVHGGKERFKEQYSPAKIDV